MGKTARITFCLDAEEFRREAAAAVADSPASELEVMRLAYFSLMLQSLGITASPDDVEIYLQTNDPCVTSNIAAALVIGRAIQLHRELVPPPTAHDCRSLKEQRPEDYRALSEALAHGQD